MTSEFANSGGARVTVSQPTPGPWLLREQTYGYDLCIASQVSQLPGAYGGWFVELHGGVRVDDAPELKAEFEANARLIAASPDLLSAAKLAEAQINAWRETGMPDIPKFMDAQDALRAAIAKAGAA